VRGGERRDRKGRKNQNDGHGWTQFEQSSDYLSEDTEVVALRAPVGEGRSSYVKSKEAQEREGPEVTKETLGETSSVTREGGRAAGAANYQSWSE